MAESNEDPRYDAEVEAARSAAQRPDSAAADREGADEGDGLEPQAAAAAVDRADTPGMASVHEANVEGVNPNADPG